MIACMPQLLLVLPPDRETIFPPFTSPRIVARDAASCALNRLCPKFVRRYLGEIVSEVLPDPGCSLPMDGHASFHRVHGIKGEESEAHHYLLGLDRHALSFEEYSSIRKPFYTSFGGVYPYRVLVQLAGFRPNP